MKVLASSLVFVLLFAGIAYARLGNQIGDDEIKEVVSEAADELDNGSMGTQVVTSGIAQVFKSVQNEQPETSGELTSLLKPIIKKEQTKSIKEAIEDESNSHPEAFERVIDVENDINKTAAEKAAAEIEVARTVMLQMQRNGKLEPVVNDIQSEIAKTLHLNKTETVQPQELTKKLQNAIAHPIDTEELVNNVREANRAAAVLKSHENKNKIGEVEAEKP